MRKSTFFSLGHDWSKREAVEASMAEPGGPVPANYGFCWGERLDKRSRKRLRLNDSLAFV